MRLLVGFCLRGGEWTSVDRPDYACGGIVLCGDEVEVVRGLGLEGGKGWRGWASGLTTLRSCVFCGAEWTKCRGVAGRH